MTGYSLWEVILNGDSLIPTRVVEGVLQPVAPTTAEQRLARKNEVKARGTLLMALPDKNKLKSNSHKDAKTLMEAIEKRFVSAAASVSTACAKLHASPLPNVDSLKMDLRWQMAMLTMRARRKGHFARECRSPKDPRRPGTAEPQRRTVPVETSTSNALVSQCDGLESVEARLLVYKQKESIFEENIKLLNIEVQLRDTALVTLRHKLEKTEQERDDLKLKLEKFQTSSKNLADLLASQTNEKTGLGYNSQPIETTIPAATPIPASLKSNSSGKRRNRKACFVCKSVDHLIKDCDFHNKKMAQPIPRTYAYRGHHKQYASLTYSKPQKHMVPHAVLTQSKQVSNTAVRLVNVSLPSITVTRPRYAHHVVSKSPNRRHITRIPSSKTSTSPPRVTAVKAPMAEAVNTACYVQNRVLVTKPHTKTLYDLLHGRTPSIGFMRPFGCLVTILNTLDPLGKFQAKVDEGFLVGYSVCSKAFRVFNNRTHIIQKTLHINFLENKPNVTCTGPTWLFDIDSLTRTMNYQPVYTGNQTNSGAGIQENFDAEKAGEEVYQSYMLFPVWSVGSINPQNNAEDAAFDGKEHDFDVKKPKSKVILSPSSSAQSKKQDGKTKKEAKGKSPVKSVIRYRDLNAEFKDCSKNSSNEVNAASSTIPTVGQNSLNSTNTFSVAGPSNDTISLTYGKSYFIDASQLPDDPDMPELEDIIYSDDEDVVGVEADFNNLESSIPEEPKRVHQALKDPSWIEAMQEELLLFKMQKVKQKKDGIFISQDKYVVEILSKFGLTKGKSASTPIDTEKPLLKDPDGEDVDVHIYRSMIGSLMYLTLSRPDIMFAMCACARFQVTPKASHLHVVKRIFRYLKGKPHLGLWYLKDLPFDLVAYSDSDYAGVSLDRKSTTGGCQFLGCKSASTPIDTEKPLLKDPDGEDVDVHTYRSMIGALMYVTSLRPDIMFASNDVTRLQALVDKKKVVITEATIRDALRLGDAKGVDCLPNEDIFAELNRMGYEKPSTKLTFYKAFFSSYWKFLIHTILLVRNVDCSSKFYMYPRFIQLIIQNQLGVIEEQGDAEEQVRDDVDDVAAQGADTVVQGDDEALDACAALFRRVEHLEYDKVAQALKITKRKRRVKKLERGNKVKVLKLRRLKKVGTSQRIDSSDDTVMEDASNQERMIDALDSDAGVFLMDHKEAEKKVEEAKEDKPEVQEVVDVVTIAKLITEVVTAASESVTAASTTTVAAESQVPTATIIAAPVRVAAASTRRRKGVVIRDPEEESTTSILADTKSKDKGKGIMVEEPKPLKKKQHVEMNEEYARKLHEELNKDIDWNASIDHVKQKAKEDPFMQRYQVMKKRPQTEAQARRNMIMYLKNVVGFRLDYFKGMSYDDIRPIFEAKFNSNIEFLLKTKEQLEEKENRAIQSINETPAQKAANRRKLNKEVKDLKQHLEIVPNEDDDVYTEATPIARKVLVVDYEIIHLNNKPHYKIVRADGTHQLWTSSSLEESKDCSWSSKDERRYPLSRFTLDQMLNAVRLRVEEQSEMSLELLRFRRQHHQKGQLE
nr:uncharacterized mitochondrial protein AtMg00810-like [Tanacetum cinerariifolium]